MCNRNTGIGADGIIIASPSSIADIKMQIINSDGSEAEMCGNGIRCITKFAFDEDMLTYAVNLVDKQIKGMNQ